MKAGTIYALASGRGQAGIAVIRISGPGAGGALAALAQKMPLPRCATRVSLIDPTDGGLLDDSLALWFPGPASFTGEDVVEFHLHGGIAVVAGVIEALASIDGLRPAEAGEFTRRAFENGKMDLTGAEAVADLVAAETAAQRSQALRQMRGALAALYEDWRARLLKAQAHMEAAIDFSEDELPGNLVTEVRRLVSDMAAELERHLADGGRGERLRDGLELAIVGPPNVGKSSLFNTLAGRDAAIVSPVAGTTRDVIEVHLDIGGFPVLIADTAGLRDSADAIEAEGVSRAEARGRSADLRLVVFSAETWPDAGPAELALIDENSIVVINKSDLGMPKPALVAGRPGVVISVKTGDGIGQLLSALEVWVERRFGHDEAPPLTRARHREALEGCRDRLREFTAIGDIAGQAEIGAEHLRMAGRALGRITGKVDVEDLLDLIFRDFCIGK